MCSEQGESLMCVALNSLNPSAAGGLSTVPDYTLNVGAPPQEIYSVLGTVPTKRVTLVLRFERESGGTTPLGNLTLTFFVQRAPIKPCKQTRCPIFTKVYNIIGGTATPPRINFQTFTLVAENALTVAASVTSDVASETGLRTELYLLALGECVKSKSQIQ